MSKIEATRRVQAIKILIGPEERAIEWLERNAPAGAPPLVESADEELHAVVSFVLGRRPSLRCRLAAGEHGSHIPTLRKLYRGGSLIERLAVLSNSSIGPAEGDSVLFREDYVLSNDEGLELLQNSSLMNRDLRVFASNPHINRDWVADTLEGWSEEKFEESALLSMVHHFASNPIVSAERDDTIMDGWDEYRYNQLNLQLVGLLARVSVSPRWAAAFLNLLPKLALPYTPDGVDQLYNRWIDPAPPDGKERELFPLLRQQITRYLIARDHRRAINEQFTLDHEDKAVRVGLYSVLSPYELFHGTIGTPGFEYPSFRYMDEERLSAPQRAFINHSVANTSNGIVMSLSKG